MMKKIDTVIIGAGPYGLSIAAHLRGIGINFRIFGKPMDTWLSNMPNGMRLKSEGFASSLYEPESKFTLEAYCKEKNLPYADTALPVAIETFTGYGLEFQKRYVPELENKLVVSLEKLDREYEIRLDDGEVFRANKVIVAVGLTYYHYLPPLLAELPETHVTHSSKHKSLEKFKGREVAILGAGSSALDLAALLHQIGAHVQVIARQPQIRFFDPPQPHPTSIISLAKNPVSGIGRGWKLFLCANAPLLFRQMPEQFRLDRVRRILGPAPSWFITPEVEGKVPLRLGLSLIDAKIQNGWMKLGLTDRSGAQETIQVEHLIAATGYRVDLQRLKFMEACLPQVSSVENTPKLSSNFESSLKGLYFVGASAANTFGPVLRFAVGARFTAKRITRHIAKAASRD